MSSDGYSLGIFLWRKSKLSPHLYAFAEQNDSFYQALGLRLHNNPLPMAYAL